MTLRFSVILSAAKNLKTYDNAQKILRYAQNDKVCYSLECDARRRHTLLFLSSIFSLLFYIYFFL